jgi:hypothetical protein
MKILITTTEYVRTEKEIEVNVPDKQLYLWHNGIRRAYSVKPKWTSWNVEHYSKPEEIYALDVVMVDPSDAKIEAFELSVKSLVEIINNDKHPYKRLADNILKYPDDKEYIRTKEQFENDLKLVLHKINETI